MSREITPVCYPFCYPTFLAESTTARSTDPQGGHMVVLSTGDLDPSTDQGE